jgi:murein DD-endopeptidase MepM/ murein hydrolase activator NlpD
MKKRTIRSKVAIAVVSGMLFSAVPTSFAASYTVQPGDTLWLIASRNQVSVAEVININKLANDMIYPGQVLTIPVKGNYTVRDGETLFTIARDAGIPLQALIQANPQLTDPNNIWSGLQIYIPVKPSTFVNGTFPLRYGTYRTLVNDYADGRSWSPTGTTVRTHEGIDIFADEGTPIYAVAGGTVMNVGWNSYGGWRLTVRSENNTVFYYAHLAGYAREFKIGDAIGQDQLIGYVGSTGQGPVGTKGLFLPHLHFGMYTLSPWKSFSPYTHLKWWELSIKKP